MPLDSRDLDSPPTASRHEAFQRLAEAHARGDFVFLPRYLEGEDRRLHVRQTLREDHEERIARRGHEAEAKFEKLARSVFSFFRGTSLLFYRDMAGADGRMPTVLALGDAHPSNFGVMPSADNSPIFGVNDFDEAAYAPFTWDLKRGAVGFMVAAGEAGVGGRKQAKIAERFVRGYLDGIETFARTSGEASHQLRLDNSPPLVQRLLEEAQRDRQPWLASYLDRRRLRFRASTKLAPARSRRDEFQEALDGYAKEKGRLPRVGELWVKDVAERKGAGTASLGLPRYYVLVEGERGDGTDDVILELKQARRSALSGLVPPSPYGQAGTAARVVEAQQVQLVGGDPFYGHVTLDGRNFLVRERSPFKNEVDLDGLSKKGWKAYAEVCGFALAHAHALADDAGAVEDDIEPAILEAVAGTELFVADTVRMALEATERVRRDHAAFVEDQAAGAFTTLDVIYR